MAKHQAEKSRPPEARENHQMKTMVDRQAEAGESHQRNYRRQRRPHALTTPA